jgi:uncharacterized protein
MSTALVTGASSGIGWEIATLLGKQGYNLILLARGEDKLNELKNNFKNSKITIDILPYDLSDSSTPRKIFAKTQELGRSVDLLVNNAGFGDVGSFDEISLERQEDMISVNVTALTALSHLYLKGMKERNTGHIVNIASTAAFQPGPLMAVYFATKAYVLSFTEALSEELTDTEVYATAICPGATHSGFEKAANMDSSKLFKGNLPSSLELAEFTLQAIKNKKTVAIHGFMNKFLIFSGRFAPRSISAKIAKSLVKKQ